MTPTEIKALRDDYTGSERDDSVVQLCDELLKFKADMPSGDMLRTAAVFLERNNNGPALFGDRERHLIAWLRRVAKVE